MNNSLPWPWEKTFSNVLFFLIEYALLKLECELLQVSCFGDDGKSDTGDYWRYDYLHSGMHASYLGAFLKSSLLAFCIMQARN